MQNGKYEVFSGPYLYTFNTMLAIAIHKTFEFLSPSIQKKLVT